MKNLHLIFLIIIATMCKSFEKFTFKKEEYSGSRIKTDGYFYIFTNKDVGYGYKGKISDAFFLYKNGVYYNFSRGGYDPNLAINLNLKKLDSEVNYRISRQAEFVNTQIGWGVFIIKGSEIVIEKWLSGSGGSYPIQKLIGEIKNDSTIHFTQKIGIDSDCDGCKKNKFVIDETYHFRQFSPKPDSANNFIK